MEKRDDGTPKPSTTRVQTLSNAVKISPQKRSHSPQTTPCPSTSRVVEDEAGKRARVDPEDEVRPQLHRGLSREEIRASATMETQNMLEEQASTPIPLRRSPRRVSRDHLAPNSPLNTPPGYYSPAPSQRSNLPDLPSCSSVSVSSVGNVKMNRKFTSFTSNPSQDQTEKISDEDEPLPVFVHQENQQSSGNVMENVQSRDENMNFDLGQDRIENAEVASTSQPALGDVNPSARPESARPGPKKVKFHHVDVYYFDLSCSFDTVPPHGGIPIGMAQTHRDYKQYSCGKHQSVSQLEKSMKYIHIIKRPARAESLRSRRRTADEPSSSGTSEISYDPAVFQHLDNKLREALAKEANIQYEYPITEECQEILQSRDSCGCQCPEGKCNSQTCLCALSNIECQVDRPNFPCTCTSETCGNPSGRDEFNAERVNKHRAEVLAQNPRRGKGIKRQPTPGTLLKGVLKPSKSTGNLEKQGNQEEMKLKTKITTQFSSLPTVSSSFENVTLRKRKPSSPSFHQPAQSPENRPQPSSVISTPQTPSVASTLSPGSKRELSSGTASGIPAKEARFEAEPAIYDPLSLSQTTRLISAELGLNMEIGQPGSSGLTYQQHGPSELSERPSPSRFDQVSTGPRPAMDRPGPSGFSHARGSITRERPMLGRAHGPTRHALREPSACSSIPSDPETDTQRRLQLQEQQRERTSFPMMTQHQRDVQNYLCMEAMSLIIRKHQHETQERFDSQQRTISGLVDTIAKLQKEVEKMKFSEEQRANAPPQRRSLPDRPIVKVQMRKGKDHVFRSSSGPSTAKQLEESRREKKEESPQEAKISPDRSVRKRLHEEDEEEPEQKRNNSDLFYPESMEFPDEIPVRDQEYSFDISRDVFASSMDENQNEQQNPFLLRTGVFEDISAAFRQDSAEHGPKNESTNPFLPENLYNHNLARNVLDAFQKSPQVGQRKVEREDGQNREELDLGREETEVPDGLEPSEFNRKKSFGYDNNNSEQKLLHRGPCAATNHGKHHEKKQLEVSLTSHPTSTKPG
uniref:CSRNP_N domain-containing protein n=1 Tax=Bursaphelenchus xylophilus TaxID=6326 RepID=A0A1I7SEA9_BURXY